MSDNLPPSEELFDVVDELDQVLYPLSRSQVHRQKLRHRAVHIFLFRSDGCLLIHQRSDTKEEFPSVWTSSASGHVSAGEGYDESAQRELQEELGVTAELQALMKFDACPDTSNEFTVLYKAFSDSTVTPDMNEMQAIRWMTPTEISAWMTRSPEDFSPAFRMLFQHYCSY